MALLKLKTNLPSFGEAIRDFSSLFFPNYCLGCTRTLVKGEEILCTFCIKDLPKTDYHLVEDNPVKRKLIGRLNLKYAWVYLKFRKTGIVQHLMHQLKYNNHPEIGVRLGKIFGIELSSAGIGKEFDFIIPVPLHKSKLKKRGYNQSAKFAEGLSDALQIPVMKGVSVKLTKTETQTKKSRLERWDNVKQAFDIQSKEAIANQRILLVDDVVTTGATLEACGQKILDCGCKELSIACIAEAQ
jgi:ComF family protein